MIGYQLTLVGIPGSRGRSKNNLRRITMGIGLIWGIPSLTFILTWFFIFCRSVSFRFRFLFARLRDCRCWNRDQSYRWNQAQTFLLIFNVASSPKQALSRRHEVSMMDAFLMEGDIGIFGFAVLAIFWIGFSVFVPKDFGFSVLVFIAVGGFFCFLASGFRFS